MPKNVFFLLYILTIISIFSKSKILLYNNQLNLPTLRLALNGKNLGDLEKIVIKKLLTEQEIIIDTIVVSENIEYLGDLELTLNNTIIKITNSTEAELYLSFAEEKNINFILNILNGEIYFDYNFKTVLLSAEGNGMALIKNLSLSLNNTIIQVPNEHEPEKKGPGLRIDGVSFNNIDMNLLFNKNGTFEKLLKYFNKNLKMIVLKIAENELNKKTVLERINRDLYNLFKRMILNIPINYLLKIEDNVNISFSMNEEPIIKNNFLELSLEAELIGDNYKYEENNNITLPHLLNNSDFLTEKTINGILSQFIINNVLDLLFYFGKFNFIITNDTLSIKEINVGSISAFINEITNGYASDQKVKIYANAIDNPLIIIHDKNKLNLKLFENLKFFIFNKTEYIYEDIGTIPIEADSELEIEANFYFNDTNIQLTLTSISMKRFEVRKTLVGEIDSEKVKTNFNSFIPFMIGNINNNINKIIQEILKPIHFEDIIFKELVIQSFENYLKFDLSLILALLNKYFNLE